MPGQLIRASKAYETPERPLLLKCIATFGAAALPWLVLAFGVFSLITSVVIVVRTYSPVLDWDQWDLIGTLQSVHDHIGLHELWAQHNEHRILVGRLLYLLDLFAFHGLNVSLLIEIAVVQILHLFVFLFVLLRFGHIPRPTFVALVGFLLYCFYSPLQMENFDWGFQIAFVITGFAASSCFALAAWREDIHAPYKRWIFLFVCFFAALMSELSEAHGILAWPLLVALTLCLPFSRRERLTVATMAAIAIAVYFVGYQTPTQHSGPIETIRKPLAILKFVITYFAWSWDGTLPNASNWPALSESISAIAIAMVLFRTVRIGLRRARSSPLEAFLLAEMLFCLGAAVMTALGRMKFGYIAATASRYQSIALVFWGALAAWLLLRTEVSKWQQSVVIHAILLVVLISTVGRWKQVEDTAANRQAALDHGWDALVENKLQDSAINRLYPAPPLVPGFYAYLRAHHWGPDEILFPSATVEPRHGSAQIHGFSLSASCLGYVDVAQTIGPRRFRIAGWSYLSRGIPPNRIALASSNGAVITFVSVHDLRPDVPKAISNIKSDRTGWSADVRLRHNGVLNAFAIDDAASSACLLTNEIVIGP